MTTAATTACIDHGRMSKKGYWMRSIDGCRTYQHRIVLAEKEGLDLWDKSWVARHTCDNKRCINPDHLVVGTHSDNLADAWERGQRGARSSDKLSQEDVAAIRADQRQQIDIAEHYGVSRSMVSLIKSGARR